MINGKGSKVRPLLISRREWKKKWEKIFGPQLDLEMARLSIKAIEEGRTKPLQEIIDNIPN